MGQGARLRRHACSRTAQEAQHHQRHYRDAAAQSDDGPIRMAGGGVKLVLPLPPSSLSPNKRNHWAVTSKAKKIEREQAHALTLQYLGVGRFYDKPSLGSHLNITYHLPGNRKRDADNLLAASKAALDGMADALRIDDSAFNPITVARVYGADKPGYMLVEL